MKTIVVILSWLLCLQLIFDVVMLQKIIDGEAAYRMVTFDGSTVDSAALTRCLATTCMTAYPQ